MDANDWLAGAELEPKNIGGRPRTNGAGKLIALECDECGLKLKATSRAALEQSGLPSCGCGGAFALVNMRDRAAIEWDALELELRAAGAQAYNDAMRELGHIDALLPVDSHGRLENRDRRAGEGQARCQWAGGHCMRYVSGRYCDEHKRDAPEMGAARKGRS